MSINKNTGPIKDYGQGQSSLRSFVRGGQTTIHSLRMFGQVIKAVAGVYFIAVAAVVDRRVGLHELRPQSAIVQLAVSNVEPIVL